MVFPRRFEHTGHSLPTLDIDDVNGTGPESIFYTEPEPTTDRPYQVGIYHYGGSIAQDLGASRVTASVYVNGALAETLTREIEMGEFLVPFEITWSEQGEGTVHVVDHRYDDFPSAP